MLKKKRFILGIFIVLLGLGLSISFLWEGNRSLDEYEAQIEHKLSPVFDEFDEDYLKLLMGNRPTDRVTFTSLNMAVDHPFYLFSEQGELLYWSNSEIIPSYSDFNKTRKYQLIENDKGTYLIQLRKLTRNEKGYWMVQMFSLYNKAEIQNEFLQAGYNPAVFGNDRFILSDVPKEGYVDINRGNGDYLFSILFRVGYENAGQNTNHTILLFFFSLLGLVIVIGGDFVRTIWQKGRRLVAIAYTVVIMVAVRAIMLGFHFPKAYIQSPLFDSTHYASSLVNPSLGDLLLNTICITVILTMILQTIGRNRFLINFIRFKRNYKEWGFLVLGYALSTLLMVAFFNLYVNIVNNSQWDLNIGALPDFDSFKAISLLIIFLCGVAYLLLTLVGLHLILYKSSNTKAFSLKVLVAFFLPIMIYFAFTDFTYLIAVLAHFVLLVAIVTFRLYENLFRLGLNTFLTFFFGCLIGALITGAAAYQDIRKNEIESKRKFANQVLLEEDFMAEFLISDVMEKISEDIFIKRTLTAPLQSKEPIVQKIKRVYLGNYLANTISTSKYLIKAE